jgi:hypothetical protein
MNDLAAPIRGPRDLQLLKALDCRLTDLATDLGAQQRQYPALIARGTLEQAEYPQAFPHLLLSAAPLRDPALVANEVSLSQNLGDVAWCLSPAVCYHSYAEFAGRMLEQGITLSAQGRCFRHEVSLCPGTRQIEFEMREIVWIGPSDWVHRQLEVGHQRLTALATELGLAGEWMVAEDPFFLPAAQGKAFMQRLQETKLEYQSASDAVALASVNRHGSFFGSRFGIVDRSGESVHTACLAVGLDRWLSRLPEGKLSCA